MKTNYNKCYLLVGDKNRVIMNVSGFELENAECNKLVTWNKGLLQMKFKN